MEHDVHIITEEFFDEKKRAEDEATHIEDILNLLCGEVGVLAEIATYNVKLGATADNFRSYVALVARVRSSLYTLLRQEAILLNAFQAEIEAVDCYKYDTMLNGEG